MRPGSIRAAPAFLVIALALVASGSGAARPSVRAIVGTVAGAERVPTKLLLAVGRLNTRWRVPAAAALNGGYGPMDLTPAQLRRAAHLGGIDPRLARHDL